MSGFLPDLALYERLINDGIAEADSQDSPVDHVNARRLAIWLAARPQSPVFAQGLVGFVRTGEISPALKMQLRIHARSGNYPDREEAARLLTYCVARSASPGPISNDFGTACDQIDRADLMLAELRDRAKQGRSRPNQAWPETSGPQIIALARQDPENQTVCLILDPTTASIAMFAIAAHADEREAHIREVERFGESLPEGSYGRRNRQAIAAREARVAARLRAVERAHRTAIEHDAVFEPPEPIRSLLSTRHAADKEIELE
jgi:hypothetical protein